MRRLLLSLAVVGLVVTAAVAIGPRVLSSRGSSKPAGHAVEVGDSGKSVEGVQVHGHWKIEVQNPDGSLSDRREFENAFNGHNTLIEILRGRSSVGGWAISFGGSPVPCSGTEGCFITEADSRRGNFHTLTVERLGDTIQLRGSATANRDGSIVGVQTVLQRCASTFAPVDCRTTASGFGGFTSTSISPAVSLVSGQQVLVEVTISFS